MTVNNHHNGSKFFRFIWGYNALVIACVATMGVVLGGWTLYLYLTDQDSNCSSGAKSSAATKGTNASESYKIGIPYRVTETDYAMASVYNRRTYNESDDALNYIFINSLTGESKWLLPNNDQIFTDELYLYEKMVLTENHNYYGNKVNAIVYKLIDKDTNGNGVLTDEDAASFASSAIDGSDYKILIEGVDKIHSYRQIADDRVAVLYRKGSDEMSAVFETPSMKIVSQQTLPKVDLKNNK